MEQMSMFAAAPAGSTEPLFIPREKVRNMVFRRDFGPAPEQVAINLKKLLRKIAFKKRYREKKGVGDNHDYSGLGIIKMHQYLYREWLEHFPLCTNLRDQYSYWSWMLGDKNSAFSFYDVLVAEGYMRPTAFIEAAEALAPQWFLDIRDLPEDEQIATLNTMVETNGWGVPAAKLVA